jgi:uncharacterized protein YcbX
MCWQENLCNLNARLSGAGEAELPMNRFRPNIVLAGGGAAWNDDDWHSITISSSEKGSSSEDSQAVVLQYVRPCSRCKVRRLYFVGKACLSPATRLILIQSLLVT